MDLTGLTLERRYRLIGKVAHGGMATVYRAEDLRLGRTVAVKVMHPHLAADDDFVRRFTREAQAAAALSHPNIVAVHDQGEEQTPAGERLIYLVMEFVDGHTLRDIMGQPLSIDSSLGIMSEVLQGLESAHRAGLVHRDIKPENVLIGLDGRIKVTDFGLARAMGTSHHTTADAGLLIGTVTYLSPEQVERGISDARSDIYSAGILLFEMLTATRPFDADTALAIAFQHVHHSVPMPSTRVAGIPPVVDALIRHSTASDPDVRPADAGAFLTEVRAAMSSLGISSSPRSGEIPMARSGSSEPTRIQRSPSKSKDSKSKSRKRKKNRTPILLLVLALIAGAGWYLTSGPGAGKALPSLVGMTKSQAEQTVAQLGATVSVESYDFDEQVPADRILRTNPPAGKKIKSGAVVNVVLSKGPERYTVPDLSGKGINEADAILAELGLLLGARSEQFSDSVEKEKIISTTPAAGTQVRRGTSVDIVVSKGQDLVALPSYVGFNSDQAMAELGDAGFKPSQQLAYSDTVPVGIVISQQPAAGEVARGTAVTITVSQGPELVKVPSLLGKKVADATRILEDLGLKYTINRPLKQGPGNVVGQSVKAGTKVKRGTVIKIDVF